VSCSLLILELSRLILELWIHPVTINSSLSNELRLELWPHPGTMDPSWIYGPVLELWVRLRSTYGLMALSRSQEPILDLWTHPGAMDSSCGYGLILELWTRSGVVEAHCLAGKARPGAVVTHSGAIFQGSAGSHGSSFWIC
jgi:hypothetical protein